MSRIVINGDVTLKRNNATDAQGVAIPPTVESMNYGEIAINYNAKDACIFIKALDANGQQKIVKFVGEEVIAKTLGDILGESAADLATLKEMIKLFEGSSSDVLTLVKNLQTEVGLKADSTYVNTELGKKLGKTETAADSSKLGGLTSGNYARFYGNQGTSAAYVDLNTYKQGFLGGYYLNNAPDPHKYTSVIATSDGQYRGMQLATSSTENNGTSTFELFVRNSHHKSGATAWNNWRKIMTDVNCNTSSINWTCNNLYTHGSINVVNNSRTMLQMIVDTENGGYITLHDTTGARGGIIRGYASSGIQAEFTKGGISVGGIALINGASNDDTHRLIVNGSSKSMYHRFGSQSGFANAGYIGCGNPSDNHVYLRANENLIIGANNGSDIIIPKGNGSSDYIVFKKRSNFEDTVLIGNGTAGSSSTPAYKDLNFKGAYGIYAQIRMPEKSISSGEGSLEFWVRGQEGASTTALPERAIRINANKNVQFFNNIEINKSSVETRVISSSAGSLFAFEDSTHNNGNAVLCGINAEGEAALWHRGSKDMKFGTSGTERMRILANGNIGIGLASELINSKLHVGGVIRSTSCFYRSETSGSSWNNGDGVVTVDIANNSSQTTLFLAKRSTGVRMFSMEYLNSGAEIRHFYNGVVKFVFTKGGALGINKTASPTQALDVNGNGLFSGNLVVKGETFTYSADGIETFEAGGGAVRLADLTDVDLSGAQGNFVLYQSTETNANGDRVWKARSDAKTWSDISGKPTTFTPVEHDHIGSTYVTTPSDRALKTDLKRIDLATNTILSLTPYTYNWTTQAIDLFGFKSHHAAGVIAQEIESILPFAVQPLNDEFKAVDYIQIIPYLIAAFQELHSALQDKNIAIANATKEYKRMYGANEKLAKRVSDLESELINLKNQIAA